MLIAVAYLLLLNSQSVVVNGYVVKPHRMHNVFVWPVATSYRVALYISHALVQY